MQSYHVPGRSQAAAGILSSRETIFRIPLDFDPRLVNRNLWKICLDFCEKARILYSIARLPRGFRQTIGRLPYSVKPPNGGDRKSTRLNSSHVRISYAVF